MPLFRRSKRDMPAPQPATSATAAASANSANAVVSDTDWADPEAVLAEWRNDSEEPNWGRAMELFDEGPVPAQRLNVAEYLTRRLKTVLFDRGVLSDNLTAEASRRVLVLLSEIPAEPAWIAESHLEFAPRLIRLPLAIMRERGWQPEKFGGDGTVRVDLDTEPIRNALATTRATDADYVRYFFETRD